MLPPIIKSHNTNAIFGLRQLRRSTGLPGIAGDQPHSISNKEPTATPSFYLCCSFPHFFLFNAHCLLSLLDQLTQKKLLKKRTIIFTICENFAYFLYGFPLSLLGPLSFLSFYWCNCSSFLLLLQWLSWCCCFHLFAGKLIEFWSGVLFGEIPSIASSDYKKTRNLDGLLDSLIRR